MTTLDFVISATDGATLGLRASRPPNNRLERPGSTPAAQPERYPDG